MTKRNIAIALFDPEDNVYNSTWPRFTGWKETGKPYIESGLFGLVDHNTRMHRFFKDTDIKTVLQQNLRYRQRGVDVTSNAIDITYDGNKGTVVMPAGRVPDLSISWLAPYTYIQEDGIEWDVYPIVTGRDIFIIGDFHRVFKTDGYWDMGIWKPEEEELKSDVFRIEQCTINHVISLGHPAMKPVTSDEKSPKYGTYVEKEGIYREIEDFS